MVLSLRLVIRLALLLAFSVWLPPLRAQEDPSLAPFVKALEDENALVRKRAAIALGRLGDRAKGAVLPLRRAAKDTDNDVRSAAAAALEKIEARLPFESLVYRLVDKTANDPDRLGACKELAERYWQQPGTTRVLEAALNDDVVKAEAAKALEAIDSRLKQQSTAPAPARGTHIAVLNLKYVVTNYKKWTNFQEEYKVEFKKFQDRVTPLEKRLEVVRTQAADATNDAETRARFEKESRDLQQQLTDIGEEAKGKLGKLESDMLVVIYKEVREAARAYALAHDLDLVMHFNDATTVEEMDGSPNIQRKMGSGPLTPLCSRPGDVDVSEPVLALMHLRYKPAPAGSPR
jgi:Skp family chaperone for outer membrane proteins